MELALEYILNKLQNSKEQIYVEVPELWLDPVMRNGNPVVKVNLKSVLADLIVNKILINRKEGINYSTSISLSQPMRFQGKNWLNEAIIYGALVRNLTAWDFDKDGVLSEENDYGLRETGTFLKTLLILPHLLNMNVNVLYLLPVCEMSSEFKKGEVGSPYAVKDFFKLDPSYSEPFLACSVETEFKALVEACHILGIRVMLDFVPRTSARDNNFILEHPDWFYWIRSSELEKYAPPRLPQFGMRLAGEDILGEIYSDEKVKNHLSKFTYSPDKLNREKWENLKKDIISKNIKDFLFVIEKEFGVITPPGFSDWINDPQPVWTDITFLRLYKDHPTAALPYVDEKQPPYILFDVIKASKFQGKEPQKELWEKLIQIMPYYLKEIGIDGARLDMGHALPCELLNRILTEPLKVDPDFKFIAEELECHNDKKAKAAGYHMIIGNLWWIEPRLNSGELRNFICDRAFNLELPVFACSETPDTPRTICKQDGLFTKEFSAIFNFVLPNGVPFITAGFELNEKQPMNIGLDAKVSDKYVLPEDDPFYGKLAFFDKTILHWTDYSEKFINILAIGSRLRKLYLPVLLAKSELIESGSKAFAYHYVKEEERIVVVVNPEDVEFEFSYVVEGEILLFKNLYSIGKIDCEVTHSKCNIYFSASQRSFGLFYIRLK